MWFTGAALSVLCRLLQLLVATQCFVFPARRLLSGWFSMQLSCAAKQELSDLSGQVWDLNHLLAAAQAAAAGPSEVGRPCAPQKVLDAPRCRQRLSWRHCSPCKSETVTGIRIDSLAMGVYSPDACM